MNAANTFTATEISRALGCSRQNVHKQLAGIAADGEKFIAGNLAKAPVARFLARIARSPAFVEGRDKGIPHDCAPSLRTVQAI